MCIEIFNHLPRDIRVLLYDANKFKLVTKNFFLNESFIQLRNTLNGQTNINRTLIKSFCVSYYILHIMYISYGLTYVHCTVLSVTISTSNVFCMDLWKDNKMNE
jgi:hypothetical protein